MSTENIRILHVIQCLGGGGASRSLVAIARYSARQGACDHRIVSLLPAESIGAELARDAAVPLIDAPPPKTLHTLLSEADVVQVHFWNSPELYRFLRRPLPPLRLLQWFHIAGDRAPQVILPQLVAEADHAVASCSHTLSLEVFRKNAGTPNAMILDSPDFQRLSGLERRSHDGFNVGYIGTVDFVKMHPDYVSMSAGIRIPGVRFILCGNGRAQPVLMRQAEALGVTGRFDFLGYREDLVPVLETLDVFGYPLCEENYATAELILQEVMYAGIPPVVFAHGGAQGTVEHGENGLVVENKRQYQAAIEHLFNEPEERRRLGANARTRARTAYGAENAAPAFNAIYQQLVTLPKRPRDLRIRETDNTDMPSGNDFFADALGMAGKRFRASRDGSDPADRLAADVEIAQSSPLLASATAGGILHYRNAYPDDPHLRLWSGLALWGQGQNARALLEFRKAADLGFDDWRPHWYSSLIAERLGAMALAEQSRHEATRRPGFRTPGAEETEPFLQLGQNAAVE